MHGIDESHRTGCMRLAHDLGNRVDGTHGVRSPTSGDHSRRAADLCLQVEHVQRAIGGLDVGSTHLDPALLQRHPRRYIGVVIENGDQQLIAALQFAADGAAEREGQGRHVRAEDDLIGIAVQEVGHRNVGVGDDFIRAFTCDEGAVSIRVRGCKIV